jgi:hypothetical protein
MRFSAMMAYPQMPPHPLAADGPAARLADGSVPEHAGRNDEGDTESRMAASRAAFDGAP